MKVTCCDCGKTYDYDYASGTIKKTTDLGDGNIVDHVECPHCGLRHIVVWAKVREKRR